MIRKRYSIAIFLLLLNVIFSSCAQPVDSLDLPAIANTDPTQTTALKFPYVTRVTRLQDSKEEAALGDCIKVEIANMDSFMTIYNQKKQRIIIYFNEIPMNGIYADFISTRDRSIIFKLTRDTMSLKSWNIFYQEHTFYRPKQTVSVSIGFENDGSLETEVKNFTLVLIRKSLLVATYLVMIVLFVLFFILVKKTGIIKGENIKGDQNVYSLSRAQLAFWTFIIIFSFLYVYAVTGEITPITSSTLVLLSISMTTTAGATIIDSSRPGGSVGGVSKSQGFLKDIISDCNGVSIHRFQMVVWTVILGVFFIRSVFSNLSMPQINDSMLVLMGISSGTYVGLKIPEKTIPATDSNPEKINEPKLQEKILTETTLEESEETPAVG